MEPLIHFGISPEYMHLRVAVRHGDLLRNNALENGLNIVSIASEQF
jgi:hypothetical protein